MGADLLTKWLILKAVLRHHESEDVYQNISRVFKSLGSAGVVLHSQMLLWWRERLSCGHGILLKSLKNLRSGLVRVSRCLENMWVVFI